MQQTMVTLALSNIRTDGGTQSRTTLSQEKIDEYAQCMLDGAIFPAIIVFYDGTDYWLADGFHRYHAANKSGVFLSIETKQGTHRDAILYSMEANTRHGIPLSLEDRKRCASTILDDEEWSQMSDREIAKICGLSHVTIWSMRPVKNEQSPAKQPVEPVETINECVKLRTPKEVIEQFFSDYPNLTHLSNREIAKRCGVTEGTVRNYKKEALPDPEIKPEPKTTSTPTEATPEQEDERIETIEEPQQTKAGVEETKAPEPEIIEDTIQTQREIEREPENEEKIETTSEPEPPQQKLPKIEASEEVQKEREIRRQQVQERNEQLREKGVELPTGKYSCLVVDPPWAMQKIEREERPNQFEFDYPTMTEEELKKFPLPDLAANDCHLYLWTTQKHLPLALRLAEYWGFKYQCLMTWVKNVGMTPFSWMYSTEHALFCTKGNLPLLAIGRRLDFSAKVREHSRKPDEFYCLVKDVSPGPRLDIFSRENREGFDQYGNEVGKYATK